MFKESKNIIQLVNSISLFVICLKTEKFIIKRSKREEVKTKSLVK